MLVFIPCYSITEWGVMCIHKLCESVKDSVGMDVQGVDM